MIFKVIEGFSRYEVSEKGLVRNITNKHLLSPEKSGFRLYNDKGERTYVSKAYLAGLYEKASLPAAKKEKPKIEAKAEVIEMPKKEAAKPGVSTAAKPTAGTAKGKLTQEQREKRKKDILVYEEEYNSGKMSAKDVAEKTGYTYTECYDVFYNKKQADKKK